MGEFDKVIGYEDTKLELRRFCDVIKNPKKYERLGVSLPRGVLLYGEPGIGKTLLAKCFIEEAGCKYFVIRKEKPNGDFVKEIKDVFEKARSEETAIVFLDDMDKYANEDQFHRDAEEYVTIQSCIDDCRDSRVFTLATVNDRYCLPDSLLRAGRFDKIIEMRLPKGKDAKRIIEHFLQGKSVVGNIDIEEITTLMEHSSCADLESVINEAGIYAGFEGKEKIDQDDLTRACMRMLFDAPECIDVSDTNLTRKVAVHEAGHAVVSEALTPGSVNLVSICRYEGAIEGITKTKGTEEYCVSLQTREMEIMRALGGKAATEIIYGEIDMGCSADLQLVFNDVSNLVDNRCASKTNYLFVKKSILCIR